MRFGSRGPLRPTGPAFNAVTEVSLGRVGAVVGLEVSRLARNNCDWYQLLELCGLMNTLIIDAEGVYDSRQLNDRLLLGLKGTMSEAELGWLASGRTRRAAKAQRGELIVSLPIGYVETRDGRLDKHPDQRVQGALGLVFQKFAELGSARQVLLWMHQEQVTLPVVARDPVWGARLMWRRPHYNSVLNLLQNPIYAGAYAFGRTRPARASSRGSRTRVAAIIGAARTGLSCCAIITRAIFPGRPTNATSNFSPTTRR